MEIFTDNEDKAPIIIGFAIMVFLIVLFSLAALIENLDANRKLEETKAAMEAGYEQKIEGGQILWVKTK